MIEAGDTAIEFSLLDPRLFGAAFWLGFLPTVAAELKRASEETGMSFVCRLTTRDGNPCGEQFPSKTALRAHQLWFSSLSGGHGSSGALLAVRSNECLWCRSLFSSVGAARQHMRGAYEMGHCRVDGRTLENTRSTAPAPPPQRKSRVNAKFVASIRRREHGAKVGGADNLRRVWRRKLRECWQAPALKAVARVQKGARSRSPRASARHRQLSRE